MNYLAAFTAFFEALPLPIRFLAGTAGAAWLIGVTASVTGGIRGR